MELGFRTNVPPRIAADSGTASRVFKECARLLNNSVNLQYGLVGFPGFLVGEESRQVEHPHHGDDALVAELAFLYVDHAFVDDFELNASFGGDFESLCQFVVVEFLGQQGGA